MMRLKDSYLAYVFMYLFYYLAWSLFASLISVYLLDLGYKASQVSLLVSASFAASMVSQPLIGWLNDRLGMKRVTSLLLLLSLPGALAMLASTNFWVMILAYSWVWLLVNGSVPVTEKIATSSPFVYGKIRIWGTLGFALGSQMAGLIYDYIAPRAIFLAFIISMLFCLWGISGTRVVEDKPNPFDYQVAESENLGRFLLQNKTYLFYLFLAMLFSGVTTAGHTYVPALLEDAGLSVGMVTTVVALAVICEGPLSLFSHKFMDQLSSKTLFVGTLFLVLIQFLTYGLNFGLGAMVLVTLLVKHTSGMLFIMTNMKIVTSLVDPRYLITALSLVQLARSLGSILVQNLVGYILDSGTYASMSLALAAITLIVLLFLPFLKLPSGRGQGLFS